MSLAKKFINSFVVINEEESQDQQSIKSLIDTNFSASKEEKGKAMELLKGLFYSDSPEANDFIKKLDSMLSGLKMNEEYEDAVKKLKAKKEELMKKQHATREKVGGGITHPEVAKVYVEISDVDIELYKLHIKETEEKLASAKKRKDKGAVQSHQNSIDYLKKQLAKEMESKKEHEADASK